MAMYIAALATARKHASASPTSWSIAIRVALAYAPWFFIVYASSQIVKIMILHRLLH
jgi:hypothetical protein